MEMWDRPWSNTLSLELIEEFRNQGALWDPTNHYYFNANEKENAWDEVARNISMSKVDCKRKMESLKGSFRRERSRANRAKQSGKGPFQSKWFAFEAMKFLDDRVDPRTCYSNPPPEMFGEIKQDGSKTEFIKYGIDTPTADWDKLKTEHESEVDLGDDEGATLEDDDDTPLNCEPFPMVTVDEDMLGTFPAYSKDRSYSGMLTVVMDPPQRDSAPGDSPAGNPVAVASTGATGSPSPREEKTSECFCQDECSTYGQHVANKLRRLDQKSRALLQHKINTLIFKAEMKMFGVDENL